eukprot:CAMPEP_0172830578 /NCGR_PEP_ID=MMETSP1075-20121228/22360_1 /TAXON_ID=2916 /ORGANISM="Ceratium fusus, Strain PA161109" /LENGTH=1002 /DNA_ID=CAMNT_0013672901 /DNA_START=144 /DNA_END=3149 /DNA_ORIENTATION=+
MINVDRVVEKVGASRSLEEFEPSDEKKRKPVAGKKPPGWFFYVDGGNCPTNGIIMSIDECHEAAVELGLFNKWKDGSGEAAKASHSKIPAGCWTSHAQHGCWAGQTCELNINANAQGANQGNYQAICKDEDAKWPLLEPWEAKYPKGWFFAVEGENCPPSARIITSEVECKDAAVALGLWNKWRGGNGAKARIDAGWVPGGCWTRLKNSHCWKTGSCELSINIARSSSNNGNYLVICKAPLGAFSGDAVPWLNIRYATVGYNLYEGDPLPILKPGSKLGPDGPTIMDPGLKEPLFAETYTQGRFTSDMRHTNPDGYHATVDQGCSTTFTTKTIRDEFQYKTDQSKTVSLSARVEAAIKFPPPPGKGKGPASKVTVGVSGKLFARAGGTLSHQWRDMQNGNNLRDQQMYRTSAKCSSYVAAYNYAQPPPTHPSFKKAVDSLGSAASYFKLFDDFGTHFLTSIRMGARYGSSMFVDKSSASAIEKTQNGIGATLDLSVGAVAKLGVSYKSTSVGIKKVKKLEAKIPLLTPKEKTAAETFKRNYVKKSTASVVGAALPTDGVAAWSFEVNNNPVPIQWESEVICQHPEIIKTDAKYTNCVMHMNSYCTQHLQAKGANCAAAAEKECYSDLDCTPSTNFQCREWKCTAVPQCQVTLYKNGHKGGVSYNLPKVTVLSHLEGMYFDLKGLQGWHDTISSFTMSDGCEKIEMANDDGNCGFGSRSNGRFLASKMSLGEDLDNDVCQVKVWAKPVPEPGWIDLKDKSVSQCLDRFADTASRAIDGVPETRWNWHSCTETTSTYTPWWQVDLGEEYDVKAVKVTNRGDCCGDRLNGFEIWTGGKTCARNVQIGEGATVEVDCVATTRTVKIQLPRHGILTLCEVGVKVESKTGRDAGTDAGTDVFQPRVSGYLLSCYGYRKPIPEAKATCKLDPVCEGITCNDAGCQQCNSATLKPTRANSFSFLKKKTGYRRLAAGNVSSSRYVYGPERRLTATKDMKVPDGWQVTVAAQ